MRRPAFAFRRGAVIDYLADGVSFLCLSLGMLLGLLGTVPQAEPSLFLLAAMLLGAYLFCTGLLWRWPVPVGAAALVGAALGIAVWAHEGPAAELFLPAGDFFSWCWQFWMGSAERVPAAWANGFYALSALAVGLPCFVFVRKVRFLPAIYLMPAALFLVLWLQGYTLIFWPMVLAFLGVLMLTARSHFWRCIRRGGRMQGTLSAGAMQLWAIPVALLVLVAAQAALPESTDGIRTPFFEQKAADISDLLFEHTNFTRPRAAFSIRSTGFMPLGSRLGGPVGEQSDRVRLLVYANMDYDIYLRGNIRNWYGGQRWLDAGEYRQYRFNSRLWLSERLDAFDLLRPTHITETSPNYEQRLFRRMRITVVPQDAFGNSTVFTAGRVQELNAQDERKLLIYFDEQGETFSLRNAPAYAGYTASVVQTDRNLSRFDETIHRLIEMEAETPSDTAEKTQRVRSLYLLLPEELPESVAEAARQAVRDVAGAGDEYDLAVALESYLKENFVYTLTPAEPPEDEDFVAYFLETGEGYCTYFASAMTVMARTLGLPSRYVEGYHAQAPNYSRKIGGYFLRDKDAHAWVEIYFSGVGWVTFDPTPAAPEEEKEPEIGGGETLSTVPTPTPSPTLAPTSTPEAEGETTAQASPWRAVAAALLAALLLVVLSLRVYRLRARPAFVARRLPDRADQADWYFRRIARQLMALDVPYYRGDTLRRFLREADEAVAVVPGTFAEVADILDPLRYASVSPSEEQIEFLSQMEEELSREARRSIHWPRFLWRCIWFPPRWRSENAPQGTHRKEPLMPNEQ